MKVFDDKLSLWNAGALPLQLNVEKLFQTHESFPRNPLIADVCYKAGYIDSWGRGVEKISEACKSAGLPNPIIEERFDGVAVELLREELSESYSFKSSEKSSEKITNILKKNPRTSAKVIADEIGISSRAVEKHLAQLKLEGRIKRVGSPRNGSWQVIIE